MNESPTTSGNPWAEFPESSINWFCVRWVSPICKSPRTAPPARVMDSTSATSAPWCRRQSAGTQVLDGDRRFDLVVRWKPEYRQSLDAVRQIRVNLPAGGQIPLDQVARVETAEGASFIYREALQRYVPVRFSVRNRDLQSTVEEAKRRIAKEVPLPEGVYLQWSGEYGELQAANRR